MSPERRRERAQAAEKAKREAAEHAAICAAYGSPEVQAWLLAEGFFTFFYEAESRRAKHAGQYGEPHIPLSIRWEPIILDLPGTKYAKPDWFVDGPGLPNAERYKRIVQRVVEGVQP